MWIDLFLLNFNYEFVICFVIGLAVCVGIFRMIFHDQKRSRAMKNFKDYLLVFEYHMEKAYEMIYRDQIMTYSLEAMHPDDKDVDYASREFVLLVQKVLGPTLQGELVYFYGGEDAFTFNLLEYFNQRYDNDEIRRTSLESMTESEEPKP